MRDEQKVELRQELAAAVGPVSEAVQGNAAEPTPTAEQATEPTKQADTAPTTATSLAKQPGNAERVAEILEALRFFFPQGERHELLAIAKTGETFGGIFGDLRKMAECAIALDDEGLAVYAGLNPLAKAATNTVVPGRHARNADVLRRAWLFFDIDPVRPKDTCATKAEKKAVLLLVKRLLAFLGSLGWLAPTFVDSGNGAYLLYRVELPRDDNGLVQRVLQAMAAKFDTPEAHIDVIVFDPVRIFRVPGTMNRKGDDTPERPWRRCKLRAKGSDAVVSLEQLQAVAAEAPQAPATAVEAATMERCRKQIAQRKATDRAKVIKRARAYLAKMDPAIQGANGSNTAYRAACVLVVSFGLSVEEAAPLFAEYSNRCQPPWSPKEQAHKLADAAKEAATHPKQVGVMVAVGETKEEMAKEKDDKEDGVRKRLLAIVETAGVFHTNDGEAYARVVVADEKGEHTETVRVAEKSQPFKDWLARTYWQQTGEKGLSSYMLEEVARNAAVNYGGPKEEVFVRVAEKDGADLLGPRKRGVERRPNHAGRLGSYCHAACRLSQAKGGVAVADTSAGRQHRRTATVCKRGRRTGLSLARGMARGLLCAEGAVLLAGVAGGAGQCEIDDYASVVVADRPEEV